MNPLSITNRQLVFSVLIFVTIHVGFGVLCVLTGWPDGGGWTIVVIAALILAVLPVLGPLLGFLREGRASLHFAGVKLDFGQAPRVAGSAPEKPNFDENLGIAVSDSNAASIAEAAQAAMNAEIVIVDLGTGRSWYPSRLFALAAAAQTLDGAKAIVLLAQRGGIEQSLIGWIAPKDLITAMIQEQPLYDVALREAKAKLRLLELRTAIVPPDLQLTLGSLVDFHHAHDTTGNLALVPILIHALQETEIPTDPPRVPTKLEDPFRPTWVTRESAERWFDPWLIRDRLQADASDAETMEKITGGSYRFVALEKNDRYAGMIDVDAFTRQIVLQGAK